MNDVLRCEKAFDQSYRPTGSDYSHITSTSKQQKHTKQLQLPSPFQKLRASLCQSTSPWACLDGFLRQNVAEIGVSSTRAPREDKEFSRVIPYVRITDQCESSLRIAPCANRSSSSDIWSKIRPVTLKNRIAF